MTVIETTTNCTRAAEDLRREQEALWEALNSCDKDTYQAVISLLGLAEAGSPHE